MDREEALKIVRDLYEKSLFLKKDKEAITTLIPELKESEDERIRKELMAVVDDLILPDDQKARFNTWLEKQKEQKPADNVSKEEYVKRFKALCDAYEIKLPNREYDIYHLCDDLSKLSIKDRVQSKPHWKPSEEQMRAVFDASERNDKLGSVLSTLYNDLKKL